MRTATCASFVGFLIAAMACLSCGPRKTISYDRPVSDDAIRIEFPRFAAGDDPNRIETRVVRQLIPASSDILLLGQVDFGDPERWCVLIAEIVGHGKGGRLIANSAIGTPDNGAQGLCPYKIGLKAPAKPGDYAIEIFAVNARQLVALGKITVVPAETKK